MASNAPSSGFVAYVEAHPLLVAGGVVVAGLLLGSVLNKNKAQPSPATTTPLNNGLYNNGINPYTGQPYIDNTGIINPVTGLPTVYVPTSTNFTTNNVGAQFSGNPSNLTLNTSNTLNSGSSGNRVITQNAPIAPAAPIVNNPAPLPTTPVVTANPIPVAQPSVTPPLQKSMQWSGSYTVKSGDTLGGIAQMVTNNLRAAGAPPTTVVTYQMIYSNNQAVINSTANAHGNPIPGGPQNNIFPGEVLRIPVWG